MTSYRKIFILLLSLFFAAASCKKDDSATDNNEPVLEEDEYETVPFSITISLTPMQGSVDGAELKQAFADGDEVEISNSQVLYEPLILSAKGCAGKTSALFSGEMKVKKSAELVPGSTKLTAALKNGTNYNNGKPFVDVKKVSSLAEGLEKYSYWACENFTYNADATSVSLVQSTVLLNVNLFGAQMTMKYGLAFYNEVVSGNCFFAVPSGATAEISDLGFELKLDAADKMFYKIGAVPPDNCVPGLFSVGIDKQVYFSTGNLQYRPMDGSWRLAKLQYQMCFNESVIEVGDNFSAWYGEDKWSDCFVWGSWVEGGDPSFTLDKTAVYKPPVDADGNLTGDCSFGSEWTILGADEWTYLLEIRPNAIEKRGSAKVDTVLGLILLPDYWIQPDGLAPLVTEFDVKYAEDIPNYYSAEEWKKMESAGAVFLPACFRLFLSYLSTRSFMYQTNSYSVEDGKGLFIDLDVKSNKYNINFGKSIDGAPVRLVQFTSETTDVKVE